MAKVVKLHICPQGLDTSNFKDHFRTRPTVLLGPGYRRSGAGPLTGHHGFYLKQCRSFRSENEGELEEKEIETARKCGEMKEIREVKFNKGSGFWSSLKSSLLGGLGFGSRRDDEYKMAILKLEEVFSSVSSINLLEFYISCLNFNYSHLFFFLIINC